MTASSAPLWAQSANRTLHSRQNRRKSSILWNDGSSNSRPGEVADIEGLVGETLAELGYTLATPGTARFSEIGRARKKLAYHFFFKAKLWVKQSAVLRALCPDFTSQQIDRVVIADENGPEKVRHLSVQT